MEGIRRLALPETAVIADMRGYVLVAPPCDPDENLAAMRRGPIRTTCNHSSKTISLPSPRKPTYETPPLASSNEMKGIPT
ncbi:unnamed protein product [Protopolystoma xenopodis]|uniref:Uncharacterized protein n=1 Tax=Protopolystoma xenopodis TaxID=117903 RepID=A0A3S4ZFV9_9PLAT|nr:unnamed protein product [Protopolystoma xenopodis]